MGRERAVVGMRTERSTVVWPNDRSEVVEECLEKTVKKFFRARRPYEILSELEFVCNCVCLCTSMCVCDCVCVCVCLCTSVRVC